MRRRTVELEADFPPDPSRRQSKGEQQPRAHQLAPACPMPSRGTAPCTGCSTGACGETRGDNRCSLSCIGDGCQHGVAGSGIAQGCCDAPCHVGPHHHQHHHHGSNHRRSYSSSSRTRTQRVLAAAARLAAAGCVLLLMLLPLLLPAPRGAAADLTRLIGNVTYPLDEQLSYCRTISELYDGIPYDLRHWNQTSTSSDSGGSSGRRSGGITREELDLAASKYTTVGGQKGVVFGFYGGTAYVLQPPRLGGLGHHINILLTYMLVMLDLQRQYGREIPDLEFVLATSDRPLVLISAQQPGLVPPVMRFCSSDEYADIKIPIFHFYTKKYTQTFLESSERLAAAYPWGQRAPIVFGRFSKYHRHIHPDATSTLRRGARNSSICRQDSPFTLSCPVRAHFMEWAANRHPDILDVKSGPRVSLAKHAAYKYLIHLDGQALSSRLEQLLPLRSLILKEESGYKTFYYHLVKPYEHYLPIWKAGGTPEDVVQAYNWAVRHDEEAQRMAVAAQAVALRYLSKRARSCYWLRLFQAYASLQAFAPNRTAWPRSVTVESYLETVGRSYEGGKHLHRIEY